jgi:hypothetical protein
MANPINGVAEVVLGDGRTLKLAFDANAWVEVEEASGLEVPEIIDKLTTGKVSMKLQRTIMWAGFRKYHPEIGIEEAGALLFEAADAMQRALGGGMPQGEPETPREESEFDDEDGEGEAGRDAEPGPPLASAGAGTAS